MMADDKALSTEELFRRLHELDPSISLQMAQALAVLHVVDDPRFGGMLRNIFSRRQIVTRSCEEIYSRIPGSDLYVYTLANSNQLADIAEKILRYFLKNPDEFKVYLSDVASGQGRG